MSKQTVFDLLHENAVADTDLLRKKDALGDVFFMPRDVDFAFKTPEEENANYLCEYINGKSFGKAQVRKGDGLYWVICIIHMPITQNVICAVSGFMVCLSRLFLVEYDGWGSVTQTSDPDS